MFVNGIKQQIATMEQTQLWKLLFTWLNTPGRVHVYWVRRTRVPREHTCTCTGTSFRSIQEEEETGTDGHWITGHTLDCFYSIFKPTQPINGSMLASRYCNIVLAYDGWVACYASHVSGSASMEWCRYRLAKWQSSPVQNGIVGYPIVSLVLQYPMVSWLSWHRDPSGSTKPIFQFFTETLWLFVGSVMSTVM